jgi:hypothetical protein
MQISARHDAGNNHFYERQTWVEYLQLIALSTRKLNPR